ncbi:MAG: O-antigen ligase family protein [Bacteroidales bacterium]|nr:O-antigen ligase family protein [Bacteroidales bacterium]
MLWEINQYKNGGNPSGHSFTQRLEYLKVSASIIKHNFWIGVGTGDVAATFKDYYQKQNSCLDPRWRLRAHNQLITFS